MIEFSPFNEAQWRLYRVLQNISINVDVCRFKYTDDNADNYPEVCRQAALDTFQALARNRRTYLASLGGNPDMTIYERYELIEDQALTFEPVTFEAFIGNDYDFETNTLNPEFSKIPSRFANVTPGLKVHYTPLDRALLYTLFCGVWRPFLEPNVIDSETAEYVMPDRSLNGELLLHTFLKVFLNTGLREPNPALVIYRWSDNWSTYFYAGKEYWGTFFWTVLDPEARTITVICASQTD